MTLASQEFKITGTRPRHVRVVVKGHLKGIDKDVEQELNIDIPANQPNNDQAALMLWQEISRIGGLAVKETEDIYQFYSLTLFSHMTAEFQLVEKLII